MASNRSLTYEIGIDAGDATGTLKSFSGAVRSAMKSVEDSLDESASAGDKLAAALDEIGQRTREEFASAAIAAERLGQALKDAGSSLDVADVLPQLQRLGLSFDEITADADKLAVSLKQLDDVKLTGVRDLESVAPGAAKGLDDLNTAAEKGRSVAANAYGNLAQDLGQIGGISGTAGVALGQLGEYAADAFYQTGNLKSALTGVLTTGGPLAAVAIGMQLIQGAMQNIAETKAFDKEQVTGWADAIQDGADVATTLRDELVETGKLDFRVAKTGLFALGSETRNIAEDLGKLNISYEEFVRLAESGAELDLGRRNEFDETDRAIIRVNDALKDYRRNEEAAAEVAEARAEVLGYANTETMNAVEGWRLFNRELENAPTDMPAQWEAARAAVDNLNAGLPLTVEQTKAIAEITAAYGVDAVDVYGQVTAQIGDEADAQREAAEAAAEHATAVSDVERSLDDLVRNIATMRTDALADAFGIGNLEEEWSAAYRDVLAGLDELDTAAAGLDLSKGLNLDDLSLDPLLDKLDALRPQIQEQLSIAFSQGGPEAASAWADTFLQSAYDELGGQVSKEDLAKALGIDNLQATITAALDESSKARVLSELDLLTGLGGETPFTASVKLAVQRGTLSASAAEAIVQWGLEEQGVDVPLEAVSDPAALAEAQAFMASFASENPVPFDATILPSSAAAAGAEATKGIEAGAGEATVPVGNDTGKGEDEVDGFKSGIEKDAPAKVPTDANTAAAVLTIKLLYALAQALRPVMTVEADAGPAVATLNAVQRLRPVVPVTAYVADYPTASEIQQMIGRPRIPVDIVVGQSIRITGVRE